MFNKCYKLKEIKGIKNFNVNKVINMDEMFSDCFELKKNKAIFVQINKSFSYREPVNQDKKLITVYFISSSQRILNYPLSSYNTDAFSIIEEKLYIEKPELKHKQV